MKRVYEHEIEVRWGDMDALGHVNNATYFTYFEQARISWFRALTRDAVMSRKQGPVMANASCEYRRAIVHPAHVVVEVLLGEPGRSSLPTGYRIRDALDASVEYATGASVLVWVDYETGKPVPLPDEVRTAAG
ncbi:MAG: thioesterase family protein [Gammaproteobacteria bacterium]